MTFPSDLRCSVCWHWDNLIYPPSQTHFVLYIVSNIFSCPDADGICHRFRVQSINRHNVNLSKAWRRIYASMNWVIIDSGNGLSPVRCPSINWTNVHTLRTEHVSSIVVIVSGRDAIITANGANGDRVGVVVAGQSNPLRASRPATPASVLVSRARVVAALVFSVRLLLGIIRCAQCKLSVKGQNKMLT